MEEEMANPSGMVLDSGMNRDSVTGESVSKKPKISSYKVKLCVGDTAIATDKLRLMETSPYFASLLRFHADDDLNAVSLVPPENVSLDTFLAMLYYLTNTDVKVNISATNLWDCIVLSKYFQVEHIEEKCLKALRKMLLTFDMDQLLRLWRNGHECAIEKVTKLSLVGISLKMESASKSKEFVELTVDELVALMSDNGFLPVAEVDVCEAIKTWCDHDPENRMEKPVLDRVLAELLWDDSTEDVIQAIAGQCQKPDEMPKRAVKSDGYAVPEKFRLEEVGASAGIIVGQFLYCFENLDKSNKIGSFFRIDMNNRDRKNLSEMDTNYTGEDDPFAEYSLCFVKLADHAKIGCFVSHWQYLRYTFGGGKADNLANTIALYDIATDKWQYLPSLPLPRVGCAIVQCGTFLYAIGGTEEKPLGDEGGANAHHCYRLELGKFTVDDEDPVGEWERIADLNAPRSNHKVKVQYGRIIVYDVQKRTDGMDGDDEEDAESWLEAYDPTLNFWYFF